MKSKSYKQADCCGDNDCNLLGYNDNEPCWGQVRVQDEEWTEDDYWWIHRCEGHDIWADSYVKEPEND